MTILEEIQALKKERNAVILAHNYALGEVQDLADFVGDSLELSRKAASCNAPVIVFCGVRFMAETAKILSPDSIVLHPSPDAGCPMADMASADAVKKLRRPKGDQPRGGVLPECDRKFDSDHRMLTRHDREISVIRDALQVLCSGQWALLEHALHNGNADQLQEASGGLRKYLEKRI